MKGQVGQRWPECEELEEILLDIKYGSPNLFEVARIIFEDRVDPDAYHQETPSAGDIIQCNMAFSEWSLFDFDLGAGMTPLRRAARKDPTLTEFADTQFYSLFWVIEQDKEKGVGLLRDMVTCEDFLVHDTALARNSRWAKGLLGSRIARVGDEWRFAGQVHLHDNNDIPSEPHVASSDGLGIQDPEAFISHVEQVLGHHGIYHDTILENVLLDDLYGN